MADSEQRNPAADGPQPEPGVGPKARSDVEPKARSDVEPKARSGAERKARSGVEPKARPDVEPNARADEEPAAERSVGELLKEARVAQDLSVEQLASELRIEAKQLVALEQDRFERIGVPVFVKGYIKQYGTRLGLDPRDLLAAYYRQGKLADIDIRPSRSISFREEQRIRGWVVALLVLFAIAVGIAVWWLNGASLGGIIAPAPPVERSEPAVSPAAGRPAPSPRASEGGAGTAERVDVEAPPSVPAPSPEREPESPAAAPTVAPAPNSPGTPPADAVAEARSDAARSAAALRPLEFAVDVEVAFAADSWAEITDARGERLFYGLGAAGRRAALRGEPPFAVVLGNADGVRISVEGADYEFPRPKQGNFARFTLQVNEE
jgi:cytoskeleton protein RodZ